MSGVFFNLLAHTATSWWCFAISLTVHPFLSVVLKPFSAALLYASWQVLGQIRPVPLFSQWGSQLRPKLVSDTMFWEAANCLVFQEKREVAYTLDIQSYQKFNLAVFSPTLSSPWWLKCCLQYSMCPIPSGVALKSYFSTITLHICTHKLALTLRSVPCVSCITFHSVVMGSLWTDQ